MGTRRNAIIDVGTNSVKLLVADVRDGEIIPIKEKSEQTRLGQGFYETHRLMPSAIAQTAEAIAEFKRKAEELAAERIAVIATSAARDAINQSELLAAIEKASGLKVLVISGEEEADLVFHGVMTDPRFRGHTLLIMDVGGGSTEFIVGRGETQIYRSSFPLGTVRLLEKIPHSDPPTSEELERYRFEVGQFLRTRVHTVLDPMMKQEKQIMLVGTGGSATILARVHLQLETYDREAIESAHLRAWDVSSHTEKLWGTSLEHRRKMPGLPAKRADVILAGVVIYESVMQQFGFTELLVTTRGLRFAAVAREEGMVKL